MKNETELSITDSERFLLGYLVTSIQEAIFNNEFRDYELGRNRVQVLLDLNLSERSDFESLRLKLQRLGRRVYFK